MTPFEMGLAFGVGVVAMVMLLHTLLIFWIVLTTGDALKGHSPTNLLCPITFFVSLTIRCSGYTIEV